MCFAVGVANASTLTFSHLAKVDNNMLTLASSFTEPRNLTDVYEMCECPWVQIDTSSRCLFLSVLGNKFLCRPSWCCSLSLSIDCACDRTSSLRQWDRKAAGCSVSFQEHADLSARVFFGSPLTIDDSHHVPCDLAWAAFSKCLGSVMGFGLARDTYLFVLALVAANGCWSTFGRSEGARQLRPLTVIARSGSRPG